MTRGGNNTASAVSLRLILPDPTEGVQNLEEVRGSRGPSYWESLMILALRTAPKSALISGSFPLFMQWGVFR